MVILLYMRIKKWHIYKKRYNIYNCIYKHVFELVIKVRFIINKKTPLKYLFSIPKHNFDLALNLLDPALVNMSVHPPSEMTFFTLMRKRRQLQALYTYLDKHKKIHFETILNLWNTFRMCIYIYEFRHDDQRSIYFLSRNFSSHSHSFRASSFWSYLNLR